MDAPDPVDHPPHYNSHPSGVETITITEHMGYLDREIARLEKCQNG